MQIYNHRKYRAVRWKAATELQAASTITTQISTETIGPTLIMPITPTITTIKTTSKRITTSICNVMFGRNEFQTAHHRPTRSHIRFIACQTRSTLNRITTIVIIATLGSKKQIYCFNDSVY